MALTSTLYTGLSGLDANQTWMNIIGNNIANVNTVAFKSSQVAFMPQFYITDNSGTAPTSTFGGTNPSQYGLGTSVADISTNFTAGSITSNGISSNLAINGNGFFVLNSNGEQLFTQDGQFSLNSNNQLVTGAGAYVQGYAPNATSTTTTQNITIPLGQTGTAVATTMVSMQGTLNAGGDVASGQTILSSGAITDSGGQGGTAAAPTAASLLVNLQNSNATALFTSGDTLSVTPTLNGTDLPTSTLSVNSTTTVGDLNTWLNNALNINQNAGGTPPPGISIVDTSNTAATFTIVGNTGAANAITLGSVGITDTSSSGAVTTPLGFSSGSITETNQTTNQTQTFTDDPIGESATTTVDAFDSLGNPVTINITMVLQSKNIATGGANGSSGGTTWQWYATSPQASNPSTDAGNSLGNDVVVGTGTVNFDSNGVYDAGNTAQGVSIPLTGNGAATPLGITLDFSNISAPSTDQANGTSEPSNIYMGSQNGSPAGTLDSYSIGANGSITGTYSNGQTQALGTVALANFNNPDGLTNLGNNMFQAGVNSGVATVGLPGTLGTGTIQDGALEQSNVDLSNEFINLIIASTGFDSSSKVITTADQLLQSLMQSQAL